MLENDKVLIAMLDGYVDDVRNVSSSLRYGTRFDESTKKFVVSEDAKREDLKLRREMHETCNQRMVRVCLPEMNSINRDLKFTAEIPEEFNDNKLPTLDFLLWLDKNGLLNWSYYQKSMKTPLVIMDKSAMSDKQRHNILANELIRRLSNTNIEQPDIDETTNIIGIFTQQLKSSGYGRKTSREIVVAGTVG